MRRCYLEEGSSRRGQDTAPAARKITACVELTNISEFAVLEDDEVVLFTQLRELPCQVEVKVFDNVDVRLSSR